VKLESRLIHIKKKKVDMNTLNVSFERTRSSSKQASEQAGRQSL